MKLIASILVLLAPLVSRGQSLINLDFGAGASSPKSGFAATGFSTNDMWNFYRHYDPKYVPGMPLVANGRMDRLKFSDGAESPASITVSNAPGVWGNGAVDPMLGSYVFAPNGSNIVVTLQNLEPGRYHFFLYGHADADVAAEQNSIFSLLSGTNRFGPVGGSGSPGQPWREGGNFVVFRDVPVANSVTIEVAPGPGGIAVLNGLQILSRGTAPPRLTAQSPQINVNPFTNILFREIHYTGTVSSNRALLNVALTVESHVTNEISAPFFEGDLALLSPQLPAGWRIVRAGDHFTLFAAAPGEHRIEFQVAPRVRSAEPWNSLAFFGPPAALATVQVSAEDADSEIELLSGAALTGARGRGELRGVLGPLGELALRWQSKRAEVQRASVLMATADIRVELTPAVLRYTSTFRFEILQAPVSELRFTIPAGQALTKLDGELVRDWRLSPADGAQELTLEFVRPVEKTATITLLTEQPVGALPAALRLNPPAPRAVQRENGALRVKTEDVAVRIDSLEGLRQINAGDESALAFQFSNRPAAVTLGVSRIEPEISTASRVRLTLEESRVLIRHEIDAEVTRAGLYRLELRPQPGYAVTEVTAPGLDDWSVSDGLLRVVFKERLLGARKIAIQLERAVTNTPASLELLPLPVVGASHETAWIGAATVSGLRIKTDAIENLREVPVAALPGHSDEILAFRADQGAWRLTLSAERLAPRVVAEVFNLFTIGDGIVGGSATIRYAIANQGVQQFRLRLPAHWRNVEFTGANLRRKDQDTNLWTISLQDKAWDAYTLVVTYDFAFDPKKDALDASGAHPLDVERESGAVAIATAGGLEIRADAPAGSLRVIDPSELADADRALISRPVLLAYRYEGGAYNLVLEVERHDQVSVLDAVADRAQLTSVLTPSGEMLTQASFMVKNNERQFQRFQLPPGASLWGVAVNGEPVKAERDGDWLLVSLPRREDRDRAFAVDINYAQQLGALGRFLPRRVEFLAPKTDVPGTYAQWDLFVPDNRHASRFQGNMAAPRGAVYSLRDGWREFILFYRSLWREYAAGAILLGGALAFVIALVFFGRRQGFKGLAAVLALFCVLAILAGMLLPALSKAKSKAQRIQSVNNLKNMALATRIYSTDHDGRLPKNLEEVMSELSSESILTDPETGQRYSYVGAGKSPDDPNAILAYSASKDGRREVAMADGSVMQLSESRFNELLAKEAAGSAEAPARFFQSVPRPANAPAAVSLGSVAAPSSAPAGFGGGTAGPTSTPAPAASAPTAAGIRSLHIEIPRTGRQLHFTRVLNLGGEPPAVRVSFMSQKVFLAFQMLFQLAAFVLGLVIMFIQWQRQRGSALWLALGAALALIGVGSLLIAWRALHLALIVGLPALLLLFFAWLVWRWRSGTPGDDASAPAPGLSPVPPAAALLLFALLPCNVSAADALSPISILSAQYEGQTRELAARFTGTFELLSTATNATVMLLGKDAGVEQFSLLDGEARLWREGEQVGVLLPQPGAARVQLTFLVKISEEGGRRRLAFDLPAAVGARLRLALDEPDAEIEFPDALALTRRTESQQTVIDAVLGSGQRCDLAWTPRLKRGADVTAAVFVQQSSLVHFGNGAISLRTRLAYQVSQGELNQVRVALPEGQQLLRVEGESVRAWKLSDTVPGELTIDLLRGMTSAFALSIETEAPLDAIPATPTVRLPRALGVQRVSAWLALQTGEELGVTVDSPPGLERVEAAEFARISGDSAAVQSAWRFVRDEFSLPVYVELLQPRLEVSARHAFSLGAAQLSLSSHFDFTISRAGIFSLRFQVPPGFRLRNVESPALKSWSERGADTNRVLEIALKQRTLGAVPVDLLLARDFTNLPPLLDLDAPRPERVDKLAGYLSVAAEPGLAVKTAILSGLTEIPVSSLPEAASQVPGTLAFKEIPGRDRASAWTLRLAVESLESWARAELATFVQVNETHLSGRTEVRFEVQNAPRKEFALQLPASLENVEISGPGIRRRDQTNGLWRLELQNKVLGFCRFTVQWEQRRADTNLLVIPALHAVDVERETGFVSVGAHSPLQATPETVSEDLLRIDARELASWANAPEGAQTGLLNFRYLRPGWQLRVKIARFSDAAVLQALVEKALFRTVVADDGQLMTQMELTVRNNGRQHLELRLPPGAKVWSAFVAGQPVRPAQEGERLLIPLEAALDGATRVELAFVNQNSFPRSKGRVDLASPRLDVPVKEARWELYLPPDYRYDDFAGSMQHEISDESSAVAADYTVAAYARQEADQAGSAQADAFSVLSKAKQDLAAGNYRDSAAKLGMLRSRGLSRQGGEAAQEVQKLEDELSRAQSSNFLNAQQELAVQNGARFGLPGQSSPERAEKKVALYDAKIAEQQVQQLQRAQQVAVAKVTPLRVNLPTRGLRHAFTQVLQTEVNKPFTIRFTAANDRSFGWFKSLALWVGAFLLLWLASALTLSLSRRRHA